MGRISRCRSHPTGGRSRAPQTPPAASGGTLRFPTRGTPPPTGSSAPSRSPATASRSTASTGNRCTCSYSWCRRRTGPATTSAPSKRSSAPCATTTSCGNWIECSDPLHEVEALLARRRVAGVVEIEDHEVEVRRLEALEGLGRRAGRRDLVALVQQQEPERVDDVLLIVGDQDSRWCRVRHACLDLRRIQPTAGARRFRLLFARYD